MQSPLATESWHCSAPCRVLCSPATPAGHGHGEAGMGHPLRTEHPKQGQTPLCEVPWAQGVLRVTWDWPRVTQRCHLEAPLAPFSCDSTHKRRCFFTQQYTQPFTSYQTITLANSVFPFSFLIFFPLAFPSSPASHSCSEPQGHGGKCRQSASGSLEASQAINIPSLPLLCSQRGETAGLSLTARCHSSISANTSIFLTCQVGVKKGKAGKGVTKSQS